MSLSLSLTVYVDAWADTSEQDWHPAALPKDALLEATAVPPRTDGD